MAITKKALNRALLFLVLGLSTACSEVKFAAQKAEVLSNNKVFEEGVERTPESSDTVRTPEPGGMKVPVKYLCSDSRTRRNNTNVKRSEELEVRVVDPDTEETVCRTSEGVRERIIETKELLIPECEKMTKESYLVFLADTSVSESSLLYDNLDNDGLKLFKGSDETWRLGEIERHLSSDDILGNQTTSLHGTLEAFEKLFVLYDENNRVIEDAEGESDVERTEECDERASPLIVDMRSDVNHAQGVELTSPLDGILFDILGLRSFPQPHSLKQISWIRNANYMFVVKPNAQGRVEGINEMFGDNTLGPDGQFAANGFFALAKYDGTTADGRYQFRDPDGRIDRYDPVYYALRLWSDSNFDGVSQPNELITLSEAQVEFIDLEYDPDFSEEDQYGNRTEMKSVVKFKGGDLRLIFDLWFRYL